MKLEIGDVFSNTIATARDRAGPLMGLWGVFLVFQIALVAVLFGMIGGGAAIFSGSFENPSTLNALGMGAGIVFLLLIAYFIYLYLYCVQSTAMALAASSRTLASFGDALSGGFRSGLSLLGVFMLLLVGYFIFTFVIGIAQLILSFLGSFGEGIVGLASFAAFVYAACRFVVIVPVVAVDGERNPVKAIRRSWEITEGHVLPIFVIVLIVGIAAIGLGVVFGLLFGGLFFATAASGAPALSTIAVMILVFGVFGGVFAVLGAALMVVLHSAVSSSEAEELGKTFE